MSEPKVLVGHSLGCNVIVEWAAMYMNDVRGALLLAPPNMKVPEVLQIVGDFAPPTPSPLPFPSIVAPSSQLTPIYFKDCERGDSYPQAREH
jgi:predicted alpha/beta hydrolase family esterase